MAGCTAAVLLARAGHSVALVGPPPESAHDAHPRIGETLSGAAVAWLDKHDLPGPLRHPNPHWKIPGSLTQWGSSPPVETNSLTERYGPPYRLDRLRFDQALYNATRETWTQRYGVEMATVEMKTVTPDEEGWSITLADGLAIATAFLFDATGRRARFTRSRSTYIREDDPLIAVWAVSGPTTATDRRTVTQSAEKGWWYGCLLPNGRALACLHTTGKDAQQLKAHPSRWLDRLAKADMVCQIVEPGAFGSPEDLSLYTTDAHGYLRAPLMGDRWVAIGDAALAFDPIAAHGISFALYSADRAVKTFLNNGQGDYADFCTHQWSVYASKRQEFYRELTA